MERKTIPADRADAGHAAGKPDPKREKLSPADLQDLEAFEIASRKSRRAVADTIGRLVRPA
jgi:hypothetical protein